MVILKAIKFEKKLVYYLSLFIFLVFIFLIFNLDILCIDRKFFIGTIMLEIFNLIINF